MRVFLLDLDVTKFGITVTARRKGIYTTVPPVGEEKLNVAFAAPENERLRVCFLKSNHSSESVSPMESRTIFREVIDNCALRYRKAAGIYFLIERQSEKLLCFDVFQRRMVIQFIRKEIV